MKKAGQENLHHLFRCLYWFGVRQLFVCPGSRNAPLLNAAASHGGFSLYSVVDERSAGYMALGAAQISNKAVGVICTSGTALVNLFPAVVEAHQLKVPLIILSADRPVHAINKWENQTINQKRIFGNYTNSYIEWKGALELKSSFGKVERIAMKINEKTLLPDRGVVHLNFHFSEPLYFPEPIKKINPFSLSNKIKNYTLATLPQNSKLADKNLMVLCGSGVYKKEIEQEIEQLAKKGALIFCDLTSPYRKFQSSPYWELLCNSLDEDFWNKNKPKTLISVGTFLLNKNIKSFIQKNPPKLHIHLADTNIVYDAYLSKPTICRNLGKDFLESIKENQTYKNSWIEQIEVYQKQLHKITSQNSNTLTDLFVVYEFLKNTPKDIVLHIANSMSIRYAAVCGVDKNIPVYANRGTSGIDGCLSTAIGAALADSEHEHFFICGDLSFFYDTNGFWVDKIPNNLKILILNNGGGNIFDIIPGPSDSIAKDYFHTPHKRTAKFIANDYDIEYLQSDSVKDYKSKLAMFFKSSRITILEVLTQRKTNKEAWNLLKDVNQL